MWGKNDWIMLDDKPGFSQNYIVGPVVKDIEHTREVMINTPNEEVSLVM